MKYQLGKPPVKTAAAILLLCMASVFGHAQAVAVKGQILEPAAFQKDGEFVQAPVTLRMQDVQQTVLTAIPDIYGNFEIKFHLNQPTAAYFDYNNQTGLLFLTPGDQLQLNCSSHSPLETLTFSGQGSVHNNYCNKLATIYRNESIVTDLDFGLYEETQANYAKKCNDLRDKEKALLENFLKENGPQTSELFKKWAAYNIDYTCANRLSEYFLKNRSTTGNGYAIFVEMFDFNQPEALISQQYGQFVVKHLRHLYLQDPGEMQQARIERGEPWQVRGFELAGLKYTGKVRDYAQAIMLARLIDDRSSYANRMYEQFKLTAADRELKDLVRQKYAQLEAFFNAPLPSNAKLTVVNGRNPLTFKQVLAKHKGKVVYLDFWAGWCRPCLNEMPNSVELQEVYANKDIVFLYISSDDTEKIWRGNIARYKISGEHVLMDQAMQIEAFSLLGVRSLPRYVLIGKDGEIVNENADRPGNANVLLQIDSLLSEN